MTPAATTKRTLSTAEERREAVLEAALDVFAQRGFLGTPTMPIAKAAGISQAYLFRLFPTKDDLVLAVVRRNNELILTTFTKAAAQAKVAGEDPLGAMGMAYGELVADRRLLMIQLHTQASAVANPVLAAAARECYQAIVELIQRETDHGPEDIQRFMATGMLINVMAATGITELDEPWAQTLAHDTGLCGTLPAAG